MSTGRGTKAARGRPARTGTVRNDAEEALVDANAEIVDTADALGGEGESARGSLPDGLLQRRLAREKAEKEKECRQGASPQGERIASKTIE